MSSNSFITALDELIAALDDGFALDHVRPLVHTLAGAARSSGFSVPIEFDSEDRNGTILDGLKLRTPWGNFSEHLLSSYTLTGKPGDRVREAIDRCDFPPVPPDHILRNLRAWRRHAGASEPGGDAGDEPIADGDADWLSNFPLREADGWIEIGRAAIELDIDKDSLRQYTHEGRSQQKSRCGMFGVAKNGVRFRQFGGTPTARDLRFWQPDISRQPGISEKI